MIAVDPLKLKIDALLRKGRASPLHYARGMYGSKNDYETLGATLADLASESDRELAVDLSPFDRIGNPDLLLRTLTPLADRCDLVLFTLENQVLETLHTIHAERLGRVAVFNRQGRCTSITGRLPAHPLVARDELTVHMHIMDFRARVRQRTLLSLLSPNGVVYPCAASAPPEEIADLSGRQFLRMPNGMLVSCYIDIKQVAKNPETLSTIAYEIVYALFEGFNRDLVEQPPCNVIVVPNNTALLLGAAVQVMTGVPVCVVDKLGPIPSTHLAYSHTSIPLTGKRACLLVEVSATGAELDRTVLFLSFQRAQVTRVVCTYNLEVGRSTVAKKVPVLNLCLPKRELGYVYRSE